MSHKKIFDAFSTELFPGTNLIEASAGTGKTFTIAMLLVRFIVEKNISLNEIMVTTFTKAATAELKERIRSRVRETLLLAKGKVEQVEDEALKVWFEQLPSETRLAATQRLSAALLDMDCAEIFTIHGFCQRMLIEFALESGQLFSLELTEDIGVIFEAVAQDYWRKHIYHAHPFVAKTIWENFSTPQALLKSVKLGYMVDYVYPQRSTLEDFNDEVFQQKFNTVKGYIERFKVLTDPALKAFFKKDLWGVYKTVTDCPKKIIDYSVLFTWDGFCDALNGRKFSKTTCKTAEQRKVEFVEKYHLVFQPFEVFHRYLSQIKNSIILQARLNLLDELKAEIPARLLSMNLTSFDQLIQQLSQAVDKQSISLIQNLQARYKVALIDEFQDTDANQWNIFSKVFLNSNNHSLYLIGDPKQAIYKFRGADIYTYLQVAEQAEHQYTLAYNWRSNPYLVEGINQLFNNVDNPFVLDDFKYYSVNPAKNVDDGAIVLQHKDSVAPMQLRLNSNLIDSAQVIVHEIILLLNGHYQLKKDNQFKTIKANDIAILVNSHANAQEYRDALWQANIPVTISRTSSVFNGADAEQLLKVLYAVCYPNDLNHIKAMLSTDYFGLDVVSYYQNYLQSEEKLDALINRFDHYHHLWLEKGFMVMMYQLLETENIEAYLLNLSGFERRLTDVIHLIELTQREIIQARLGMLKTLEWFQQQIQDSFNMLDCQDTQKMRLESERETVTILTMHASKGLEYPVVFCPNLAIPPLRRKSDAIIFHKDGLGQVADLGSEQFDQHQQQVAIENLSEKMRLLYVAVTRAKYLCYLFWDFVDKPTELSVHNHSAFSYLLGVSSSDNNQIEAKFNALANKRAEFFNVVKTDSIENLLFQYVNDQPEDKWRPPVFPKQKKRIDQNWQMTSYTALSKLTQKDSMHSELFYLKADDEILFDQESKEAIDKVADDIPYSNIPKGASSGNLIHEILEVFSFSELVKPDVPESALVEIKQLCFRFSLEEDIIPELIALIQNTLTAPIIIEQNNDVEHNKKIMLTQLADSCVLKEMPFYLAIPKFNTQQINLILKNEKTYHFLGYQDIEGLLNGFIDLIFEFGGKYYLADYKSNYLENYDQSSLIEAMHQHNYGLQLWIYTVVVNRYLAQIIPEYCYEKHFGGAFYFFVRGINHDASSGIYFDKPDFKQLQQLDQLICQAFIPENNQGFG